jgi:hypothetical protein
MFEHANRHDAVVLADFVAVIAEMKPYLSVPARLGGALVGDRDLLGRERDSGDVDSRGLLVFRPGRSSPETRPGSCFERYAAEASSARSCLPGSKEWLRTCVCFLFMANEARLFQAQ